MSRAAPIGLRCLPSLYQRHLCGLLETLVWGRPKAPKGVVKIFDHVVYERFLKGHDKEKLIYSFPAGESMHDQMRADICHSLFDAQQEATLLALLRHNESSEAVVYSSLYWDSFEHANATNTSAMAYNFENQNQRQTQKFKADFKDNEYSYVPKLKDDFHDVFAQLEKEMAIDPDKIAFAEAAESPIEVGNVVKGKSSKMEEVVPQMAYGQPHSIRKYPGHLNQQDTFENPYFKPNYPQMQPQGQMGYPQYPQQGYPQYQPQYGKRRRKRQAKESYDAHFGLHRIMSTGIQNCKTFRPSLTHFNPFWPVLAQFSSFWMIQNLFEVWLLLISVSFVVENL